MAYVDPNEPSWDKKARENNFNLPPLYTIGSSSIPQGTTTPGSVTYSSSGNYAYYEGDTFTVKYGTDGWQYLEKNTLNNDQQNVFEYLSKVMQFSTK